MVAEVARHQRHGVLRRVQVSGLASFAFIGALAERNLIRLTLDGDKVVAQERLLGERGKRIRDVRVGPDGHVYVLTDESPGELLRIAPAGMKP